MAFYLVPSDTGLPGNKLIDLFAKSGELRPFLFKPCCFQNKPGT